MNKLKTTTDIVMNILQNVPKTRNSDNMLYYFVLRTIGNKNGIDIDSMSLPTFLIHMKDFGLPSIETVGRCRRKIVETHPELAGISTVEAGRCVQEEVFREYARKVNV